MDNWAPMIVYSPLHTKVTDNDNAGIQVLVTQHVDVSRPDDGVDWIGDHVAALALHDVSLTGDRRRLTQTALRKSRVSRLRSRSGHGRLARPPRC